MGSSKHILEALEILNSDKQGKENACEKISRNSAFSQIPVRWWKQLVQIVGEKCWTNNSNAELHRLGEEFTAGDDVIDGNGQFKEEFVTCGVKLNEVDFKTMQSRVVANLFFASEVLNIDSITGSFNFHSSWTTVWLAGSSISHSILSY